MSSAARLGPRASKLWETLALAAPVVYGATAAAFLYPLSEPDLTVVAAVLASIAALLAVPLARTAVHTWVIAVSGVVGLVLSIWMGSVISGSPAIASQLGATETLL